MKIGFTKNNFMIDARATTLPIFAILLSSLFIVSCGKQEPVTQAKTTVQPLELIGSDLVKPEYRQLSRNVSFTGTLQAKLRTSIQAETSGTVIQLYANNGDRVNKGQTLLRLNNQDDQARFLQEQANFTAAKAQADLSKNLAERNRRLFQQGYIAEIEYERSKADAQAQRANLDAQQALVTIAKKAANDATVQAPMSGIVSNRQVQTGQTVASGQTLFEIVDTSTLELQGSVPDNNQTNLRVGQTVQYQFAGQSKPVFTTRISRINPIADASSRALLFYADVNNNTGSLNIGNYVQGTITLEGGEHGLVIPSSAIWQEDNQSDYVWAVRHQKLVKVNVTILAQDKMTNTALVAGIEPTDQVSLVKVPDEANGRIVAVSNSAL